MTFSGAPTPSRVLIVHNYYGSEAPSGENAVFHLESELLRSKGHEVQVFTRHSDEIRSRGAYGLVKGALATPWNPLSALEIRRCVSNFEPDVVHVHNTFPLISPAIFPALRSRAARVLTLHNYRTLCPAGIPMRDGKPCTECIDRRSISRSLRYGCYRGSRLATVPLAVNVGLHRVLGTWRRDVDAFIALSEFQKDLMSKGGLPTEKIHVKPNFFPGDPSVIPWRERDDAVLFVGRLSEEKGVVDLIEAWRKWGGDAPLLHIVGDGELRQQLEMQARDLPVKFFGQLESDMTLAKIANSRILVIPSLCFEGFPMVLREAFAFGTPAAVSRIGPLPRIVKHDVNGVVFEPRDSASLLEIVREAWEAPEVLERLGLGARNEYSLKYSEETNYEMLISIYKSAIETQTFRSVSAQIE